MIERMKEINFSKWAKWEDRKSLPTMNMPGVYCIAISESDLSGQEFEWFKSIAYVGMTNSKAGLTGRLRQFENTIKGKRGHGGASRFRYKHPNYQKLVDKLYVSVCAFECDVTSGSPKDLRIMGAVANFEYDCFAQYVEKFGKLPEFNDRKKSPKK